MTAAPGGLHLLASHGVLPPEGEAVKLPAGHGGTLLVELPAFTADPRCAGGVPARLGRRIDRYSALAYQAVSGLASQFPLPSPERVGVFLASTRAGWGYGEQQFESLIAGGPRAVHPYFVTAWFPAACIGEVTIGLGYQGPAKTTTGRLSGFAEALWLARDALERQAADVAIVGAVDSLVSPFVLQDWAPGQALPATGAAEGAVVFAVARQPMTGSGGQAASRAELRDLRHDGGDRGTPWDRDWLPTLSIAAELARHASGAAGPGRDTDLALGGGYRVTVQATTP